LKIRRDFHSNLENHFISDSETSASDDFEPVEESDIDHFLAIDLSHETEPTSIEEFPEKPEHLFESDLDSNIGEEDEPDTDAENSLTPPISATPLVEPYSEASESGALDSEQPEILAVEPSATTIEDLLFGGLADPGISAQGINTFNVPSFTAIASLEELLYDGTPNPKNIESPSLPRDNSPTNRPKIDSQEDCPDKISSLKGLVPSHLVETPLEEIEASKNANSLVGQESQDYIKASPDEDLLPRDESPIKTDQNLEYLIQDEVYNQEMKRFEGSKNSDSPSVTEETSTSVWEESGEGGIRDES
ncbi:MAG: hypothetical protein F6K10_41160, partial [Moorea sp. SIO2B7]|nr:hypothetical protein [Moorena sp. SIO2B7]